MLGASVGAQGLTACVRRASERVKRAGSGCDGTSHRCQGFLPPFSSFACSFHPPEALCRQTIHVLMHTLAHIDFLLQRATENAHHQATDGSMGVRRSMLCSEILKRMSSMVIFLESLSSSLCIYVSVCTRVISGYLRRQLD